MAASATAVSFIPVEEYLSSTYRPDLDYVDGALEERNLGEYDHADLQAELVTIFRNHRLDWKVKAVAEVRVQVAPTRFRVPDVCVLAASWIRSPIVREAPLLCIEVLSPRDNLARITARAQDFLYMGVSEVWIFDSVKRTVSVLRKDGAAEHRDGILRLAGTAVEIRLADVFGVLDQQ